MDDGSDLEEIKAKLEQLAARISDGDIGSADDLWGGADVVISFSEPPEQRGGFYPAPRQVVTVAASELSWLFTQLRDLFANHYDGQTKIEFFGRLANAALRYQAKRSGDEQIADLLGAVLHEAFAIADEMEEGHFQSFAVAIGSEIVDDYIDEAERTGFIGVEETRRFFTERGIAPS